MYDANETVILPLTAWTHCLGEGWSSYALYCCCDMSLDSTNPSSWSPGQYTMHALHRQKTIRQNMLAIHCYVRQRGLSTPLDQSLIIQYMYK